MEPDLFAGGRLTCSSVGGWQWEGPYAPTFSSSPAAYSVLQSPAFQPFPNALAGTVHPQHPEPVTSPLRQLFPLLLSLAAVSAFAADEPAKDSPESAKGGSKAVRPAAGAPPAADPATADTKPTAPGTQPAASEVITLPAVQVTKSRVREIDLSLKRIDKQISRERKKLKSTETDRVLNHDQVAKATALFGGKSTAQRESVAAERVRLLETERDLLEQMKSPMTRDDFQLVEKQVELLRTARRELDLVYR